MGPKCQGAAAKDWLAARQAELLDVPYYHVVFTLPAAIFAARGLGSRAVLGLLKPGEMSSAVHVHSGKTLAECMDEAGFDSAYFWRSSSKNRRPFLGSSR